MGHFGPPPMASSVESAPSISSPQLPGEGVDALPLVSPINSHLSIICSCISSPQSYETPLPGSALLWDPCPRLCCLCRIGSGWLCSPSSHPDISSGQETFAPSNRHGSSHGFHPIGLSPSRSDGSHLANS
jgi:hypothetical protein